MNTNERVDMLKEAQDLIAQAVALINSATRGTEVENAARSYLVSALETAAAAESDWLGRNPGNIDRLIEDLLDFDADDDDDEIEVPSNDPPPVSVFVNPVAKSYVPPVADAALVAKCKTNDELMALVHNLKPIDFCKALRLREIISLSEAKAVYDALKLKVTQEG